VYLPFGLLALSVFCFVFSFNYLALSVHDKGYYPVSSLAFVYLLPAFGFERS
jgi:hypothetical protein